MKFSGPPETSPILLSEPATRAVCAGDDVVLEVTALTDGDASYQWRVGGEDILDATESTLAFSSFTEEDVGGYSVIVTDDCDEISSSEAEHGVEHQTVAASRPRPLATQRMKAPPSRGS